VEVEVEVEVVDEVVEGLVAFTPPRSSRAKSWSVSPNNCATSLSTLASSICERWC